MTSPTSAATDRFRRAARRGACGRGGFTIVELLVVIGIMILLAAILLPMVLKAYGKATSARMAADLAAISGALEAYQQDHGSYPLVRFQAGVANSADRPNPPTGAQILCQALIGPAPKEEMGTGTNRRLQDGSEGPGFRVRPNGKVYGPYLAADQFRVGVPGTLDVNPGNVLLFCILDRNDQPILYFPASPTKPNVREEINNGPSYVAASEASLYDVRDNQDVIAPGDPALALTKMRLILGERTVNGLIDGEETAAAVPFVLWSAGADDIFGPRGDEAVERGTLDWNDVAKCDDVTNVRQ